MAVVGDRAQGQADLSSVPCVSEASMETGFLPQRKQKYGDLSSLWIYPGYSSPGRNSAAV